MCIKRTSLFVPFFFVFIFLSAQEKASVAVLDTALLDGDIPHNASMVAATYLNDSFSASPGYAPLDRRLIYTRWNSSSPGDINIVSLVQRGEYARLGGLLGADFLCLSSLQRDGGGYLLTAELYDISQGGVVSRETARAGRLEELLNAGRLAGAKLSGASPTALPEPDPPLTAAIPASVPPAGEASPRKEKEPAVTQAEDPPAQTASNTSGGQDPEASENPSSGRAEPFGSMTLSLLLPTFVGNEEFTVSYDGWVTYEQTPLYDLGYGDDLNLGMDFNLRFTGTSYFCLDLGFTLATQILTYDTYDYYYGYEETTSMSFGFFDFYLGLGAVLPLSENLQLAGVGTIGYGVLFLGAEVWDSATISSYDGSSGITLGITAGIDFKTASGLVLTLRYRYSYATELDLLGTDFGYHGVLLGLGTVL